MYAVTWTELAQADGSRDRECPAGRTELMMPVRSYGEVEGLDNGHGRSMVRWPNGEK